jgi:hypothetical protein
VVFRSAEGLLEPDDDTVPEEVAASGGIATSQVVERSSSTESTLGFSQDGASDTPAEGNETGDNASADTQDVGDAPSEEELPHPEGGDGGGEEPPEDPPNPENAEPNPPRRALVEHRHVGDTKITVALADQTMQNVSAIAWPLDECDVVAIEAEGVPSEDIREEYERFYTQLISTPVYKEQIDPLLNAMVERGEVTGALLSHLRGTDKKIVLLGIGEEDPRFAVVSEARQVEGDYIRAVRDLIPLDEARPSVFRAIEASAEAMRIRDEVMAEQAQALVETTRQQGGALSIGIAAGRLRHEAIATIGEEDPTEAGNHEQNAASIEQDVNLYNRALRAFRKGDTDQVVLLANKVLLSQYISNLFIATGDQQRAHEPLFHAGVDTLVAGLSDTQVTDALETIRDNLSDPIEPMRSRAAKVRATLQPAVDVIRGTSQRIE